METIKYYLDSMFKGLGNSAKVFKAKEELLTMMEDKYQELINEGVSETTAIGQVISEFGDLNEVAETLGISEDVDNLPLVTIDDTRRVVSGYKAFFPRIAWGV